MPEVAALIGRCPAEIYRLVREGSIPHRRLGNTKKARILFSRSEITAWAKSRESEPTRLDRRFQTAERLGLLGANEVAARLQVTHEAIGRLVAGGFLRPWGIADEFRGYSPVQVEHLAGVLAAIRGAK